LSFRAKSHHVTTFGVLISRCYFFYNNVSLSGFGCFTQSLEEAQRSQSKGVNLLCELCVISLDCLCVQKVIMSPPSGFLFHDVIFFIIMSAFQALECFTQSLEEAQRSQSKGVNLLCDLA